MEEKDLQPNGEVKEEISADLKVESTENLSESDVKAIDKESRKQEKRAWNKKRKIKRGLKTLRCRKIKNLLFFITGFFTSIILLLSGILIGVKFIPMKTYLGSNGEYVNPDTAGEKSIVDFVTNLGEYQVSDIPVIANMLEDLVTGAGLSNILTIDTAKLKETHFNDIGNGILNSAKISKDLFGALSELDMFKTVEVPSDEDPSDPANGITEFEPKLYYYLKEEVDGNAKYERAFNDDKTIVEDSSGKQLYYLSLTDMSINDLKSVFSERFKLLKIKSVFKTLAGVGDESFINDVIGDRNIKDLSSFGKSDIKLVTALGEYDEEQNGKLYKLIWDATHFHPETTDEITGDPIPAYYDPIPYKTDPDTGEYILDEHDNKIYDFSSLNLEDLSSDLNIDSVRLTTVLGEATTEAKEKLYKLVWDATHYTVDGDVVTYEAIPQMEDPNNFGSYINDYSSLNLNDLSGSKFDINMARLVTVLGEATTDAKEKLYKLVWDASRYTVVGEVVTYEAIPQMEDPNNSGSYINDYSALNLKDLSGSKFDINMARLVTVLGKPETAAKEKLYKLIWDASHYIETEDPITHEITVTYKPIPTMEDPNIPGSYINDYSALNLKDLSGDGFNINRVRLSTVLNSDTGNKVIDKLRTDPTVSLDNIGEKANSLTLNEILDVEVMVAVADVSGTEYDDALYTYNELTDSYELVNGIFTKSAKKYSYTGVNALDSNTTYYIVNHDAGVWFLPLTERVDYYDPSYKENTDDAVSSVWGAYQTIRPQEGETLEHISDVSVDISSIKIKVLIDLGLLPDSNPSGHTCNLTIIDLLATAG